MSSSMKSPLHNFPLPDLQWSMNQKPNTRRFRNPSTTLKSPHHGGDSSASSGGNQESEAVRMENSIASPDRKTQNCGEKLAAAGSTAPVENTEKKSKFFIRFRAKTTQPGNDSEPANGSKSVNEPANAGVEQSTVAEELDQPVAKTWNLRPRRSCTKPPDSNGGALRIGGAAAQEIKKEQQGKPELVDCMNATGGKEKDKGNDKKKIGNISIPLAKEQIAEDLFVLTGSKPSRRPKKRAKHVQRQLDAVFPGLWLHTITPDSYKVNEGYAKMHSVEKEGHYLPDIDQSKESSVLWKQCSSRNGRKRSSRLKTGA